MKGNKSDKIDFIIPWVDGSDPKWIEDYNKHVSKDKTIDVRNFRFRDWDNLQYWFRGIEKFTPWVNKIHFITWGHIPKWLNINHPKLNIVKHEDYIPDEYLPTFSSHPIELNMHRIEGLVDKFVYFNDDTYIIKPTNSDRFFINELPRNLASEIIFGTAGISHIRLNVMHAINKHFDKRKQFKKNIRKWFNLEYKFDAMFKTALLLPFKKYSAFQNKHKPNSFLKKTFLEVWQKNETVLKETSANKFRSLTDVNQYLFEYWQLVKGDFEPISMDDVTSIELADTDFINIEKNDDNTDNSVIFRNNIKKVADLIRKQKYRMICINDGDIDYSEFEIAKKEIIIAFNEILPEKSSFEI